MNWKRLIISIIVIAILVAGGYWAYANYLAPKPEPETAVTANTIAIDTGVDSVAAEAQVLPREHAMMAFEIGGPVVEILVEEGQSVQAGDPLLRLDARDQEIIVQQAETAVLQAQSQLAAAQSGQAAAEVGLTAANTAVAAVQAQLNLLTADPTAEQIALQQAQVAAAQAGIQQASGSQAVVLDGATSAEIGVAEAELAAAQAELFVARMQYEPLAQNEDANADNREQAQLRLSAAIASEEAAQAHLDELQAGATSPERQTAAGAVGAAASQRDAAAAQLDLLLAGSRPEAIAVAQANLEQAQSAVTEAELGVQQAETAVTQAEAGVAEAETAVQQAQALLDKMTLTAPFAGTVANISVQEGEVVQPGVPVITLADFSAWHIETTDLNELNVVAIKVGDPVNVTIDAFPGAKLRGHISDIASTASLTRGDVTYAATITLDEVDLPLRWGMTAFVTVDVNGGNGETAVSPTPSPDQSAITSDVIYAEGDLEPLSYATLSFQRGGRVRDVLAAKGDSVQAGDPLLRLDTADAEIALQQAQAQLATAQAGLAAAQTRLQLAQAGVPTAEDRVTVAEAQLALAQSGPLPEEVAAAEANVAAAAAGVTQAAGSRDAALDIATEAAIHTAEAGVASATADRRALENQYDTIINTCYDTPAGEVCPLYGPIEEGTRAQLEAARQGEAAAQTALDQLLAGPTAVQRNAANGAVAIAQAKKGVAEAQLALLQAGATPEQIAQTAVGVDQAEVGVAQAEVAVQQAETAVSAAEVQVAAAQIAVNAAQLDLERLTLTAPFSGVVADVLVNPGEIVGAGMPILTLADLSGWQVQTTDLTELDIAQVVEGSPVEVTFDALPDTAVPGTVTHIAFTPGLSQGDVVYEVTVRLETVTNLPLRWGMTSFVNINK